MRQVQLAVFVAFALTACGGGGGGVGAQNGDSGGTTTTTPPNPDAPVVTGCLADCELVSVGTEFYQWQVSCAYTDAQGLDTVETFGTLDVSLGDAPVTSTTVVADKVNGQLVTSFIEDQVGVYCDRKTEYTFFVTLKDLDGNEGTATFSAE